MRSRQRNLLYHIFAMKANINGSGLNSDVLSLPYQHFAHFFAFNSAIAA